MKKSLQCLGFILFLFLYSEFVIDPYGSKYSFFNEGAAPEPSAVPLFILMTFPIYIAFIVFFFKNIKKFKYIRALVYPISFFTLLWGLFTCLCAFYGGVIFLFLLLILLIPAAIVLILLFFAPLYFDFMDLKSCISNNKEKIKSWFNFVKRHIAAIISILVIGFSIFYIHIMLTTVDIGKFTILKKIKTNGANKLEVIQNSNKLFIYDDIAVNDKINYSIFDLNSKEIIKNDTLSGFKFFDVLALKNGGIFIYGDRENKKKTKALIFYPDKNIIKYTSDIPAPNFATSLLELSNGNILITGGAGCAKDVIEYNRKSDKFIIHNPLKIGRITPSSLELPDNRILILGGDADKIEIYNLKNDTSKTIDIHLHTYEGLYKPKLYLLKDGKILFSAIKKSKTRNGIRDEYKIAKDINSPQKGYRHFYTGMYTGILDLKTNKVKEIKPYKNKILDGYEIELLPNEKLLISGGIYRFLWKYTKKSNRVRIYDLKTGKMKNSRHNMKHKKCEHKIYKLNNNQYIIWDDFIINLSGAEILQLKK